VAVDGAPGAGGGIADTSTYTRRPAERATACAIADSVIRARTIGPASVDSMRTLTESMNRTFDGALSSL
jgi:hypothetical protein